MRTLVLALAGFFAAAVTPASASDLRPAKAPSAVAAPVNWTGFYVGINGGAGMADGALSDLDCFTCANIKFQTAFATAGGQIGYNWQWRAMVLGLEGDLNWASANASDAVDLCCSIARSESAAHFKFDAFASVRGRMGLAFDNALVYVTAGPAWGHFSSSAFESVGLTAASTDKGWRPGLAIGAGAEFMLASNWTLRGEYLFLHFKDIDRPWIHPTGDPTCTDTVNCRLNYAYAAHLARLGLNYRFGY